MGLRGPKPKPEGWFKARGTRPTRDVRTNPQPAHELPTCPDWLDDEAKACWKELIPQLDAMDVVTKVDGLMLTKYCQLWSRWKKAEMFIQRYGNSYPIKHENGSVKCFVQYPEVGIARTVAMQLARLGAEFGLSPSSRTRINVPVRPQPMSDHEMEFYGPRPGPGMVDDGEPPPVVEDEMKADDVSAAPASSESEPGGDGAA